MTVKQTDLTEYTLDVKRGSIDLFIPNNWNVNEMDKETFEKLKESIKLTGAKYLRENPIKVRENGIADKFEIVDGEHRWRACKELGIKTLFYQEVEIDEVTAKKLNFISSRNRGKDNYYKDSKLLNEFKEKYDLTRKELSKEFGAKEGTIAYMLLIYPRLKNYVVEDDNGSLSLKTSDQIVEISTIANDSLGRLAQCSSDMLREILIRDTIQNGWTSGEIEDLSIKFNDIYSYIQKKAKDQLIEPILNKLSDQRDLLFSPKNSNRIKTEIDKILKKETKKDGQIENNLVLEFYEKYQNNEITREEAYKLSQEEQDIQDLILEKVLHSDLSIKRAIYLTKQEIELEKQKQEQLKHQKEQFKPIIYKQDALEFLDTIEDRSQDLLLTDPVYMEDLDMDIEIFVNQWVPRALSKVKDTGRIYIFTGNYPKEIKTYIDFFLKQDRFLFENILIWTYKNTIGPSTNEKYKNNYQCIFYLYGKDAPPLNTDSLLEKLSVKEFNSPDGRQYNRFFKWQKPDDLTELILKHSTQEGDKVFDPFAGSGTFVLKSTEMKRFAKGSEIDPEVIEIAKKRGCIIK